MVIQNRMVAVKLVRSNAAVLLPCMSNVADRSKNGKFLKVTNEFINILVI